MWVEFGNENAVEGYRDPTAENPDKVLWRPLEGQRITSVTFPEDVRLQEAFTTAVSAISMHFANDGDGNTHSPTWVDSDNEGLKTLLQEQFGVQGKARPKTWGKDTGADASPTLAAAHEQSTEDTK